MIKDLKDIKKMKLIYLEGKQNLGFLIQNGFNVPAGFCISTKINELTSTVKKETIKRFRH